jgi:hypothetical protein
MMNALPHTEREIDRERSVRAGGLLGLPLGYPGE